MVFPSKTDTFGNVVTEANATGTPVAAYDVTGPKDIIPNGINGFIWFLYVFKNFFLFNSGPLKIFGTNKRWSSLGLEDTGEFKDLKSTKFTR